jgi:hypothetical protein
MLNIFKNKQNSFNDKSLNTNYITEKNNKIQSNYERDEYNNIIFYTSSSPRGLVPQQGKAHEGTSKE